MLYTKFLSLSGGIITLKLYSLIIFSIPTFCVERVLVFATDLTLSRRYFPKFSFCP